MKSCENCNSDHTGTYGSGRFCSLKCSRSYSTKAKRKEINEKVSAKIVEKLASGEKIGYFKKSFRTEREFVCEKCKKTFTSFAESRIYCSKRCQASDKKWTDESRKKISDARIDAIENGGKTGIGIKSTFNFDGNQVQCDSKLEHFFLFNFTEKNSVQKLKRCEAKIEYLFNDHTHIFIPDFEIISDGKTYIVECKSTTMSNFMDSRWNSYTDRISPKMNALSSYCQDNGFEMIWFTEKTLPGYFKYKI